MYSGWTFPDWGSPSSSEYATAPFATPSPSFVTAQLPSATAHVTTARPSRPGNREMILYEGQCDINSVIQTVTWNICFINTMCGCCLWSSCVYPNRDCSEKAAQSWRLYLTKSDIHYTWREDYKCLFCDRPRKWTTPLADIQEISVQRDSTTIVITTEPRDVYCYRGKPCPTELTNFTITSCKNAAQFVEAVKKQMELIQNQ